MTTDPHLIRAFALYNEAKDVIASLRRENAALADRIAELKTEVERLRALVESAYREGYCDGSPGAAWRHTDEAWAASSAKAKLQGWKQ